MQSEMTALMARTRTRTIFAGIDRMERLKGVPLKLLAFEAFLRAHGEHVGRVSLYQISLTAKERGADYETTRLQVRVRVRLEERGADCHPLPGPLPGPLGPPSAVAHLFYLTHMRCVWERGQLFCSHGLCRCSTWWTASTTSSGRGA